MIELAVAASFAREKTEEQFGVRPQPRRARQTSAAPAARRTDRRPAAVRRPRWLRGLARVAG
jgi:hypothetical protein